MHREPIGLRRGFGQRGFAVSTVRVGEVHQGPDGGLGVSGVELCQHGGLHATDVTPAPGEQLLAGSGEADDAVAAVPGVGPAVDEPAGLEPVQDGNKARLVPADLARQLVLRLRRASLEAAQDDVLPHVDAVRVQEPGLPLGQDRQEPVQQSGEILPLGGAVTVHTLTIDLD